MFRILLFIALLLVSLTISSNAALAQGKEKTIPQVREQLSLSFAPLVKKSAPAVVNIYARRIVEERRGSGFHPFFNDPFFEKFFGRQSPLGGMSRKRVEQSLGSGVIVEPGGLVITNAHVIRQAQDITVALADGRELPGEILLSDDPTDIALLQIQLDDPTQILPFIDLKPSESLEVGDLVLAIGNPFGVGQTVTSGIVSALARSSLNINDFNFFIQTDAAINPGNSGGPLLAMDGGVVGINTAIFSRSGGSLGIGFAVPSEIVAGVISAHKAGLFSERGVIRPWLGVSAQPLTGEIAESLGLRNVNGALISELHSVSPFLKAGIEPGDVIVKVDHHDIRSPAELKFRMTMVPVGKSAIVVYDRQGKKTSVRVTTISAPDRPARNITELSGGHPLGGAVVGNLNPALSVELGIQDFGAKGVVVTKVKPRSRAARLGLEPGILIREVNGKSIENVRDVQSALNTKSNQTGWSFRVEHNGRSQKIILR